MEISYDNQYDAFVTREQYKLSEQNITWDMPGVMFPYSHDKYITIAIDANDRSIQLKCITHILQADAKLQSNPKQVAGFSGWVADMVGGDYYTTRIYAEAIDKDKYFQIRSIPFSTLPRHLQDQLSRKLESRRTGYVFS